MNSQSADIVLVPADRETGTAIGIAVFAFVFGTYALSSLMLFAGYPINGAAAAVAAASAGLWLAIHLRSGRRPSSVAGGLIAFVVVLSGLTLLQSKVFDLSYDGMSYHQEAVMHLMTGWIPTRAPAVNPSRAWIWIDHYPQGTWIFAATVAKLLGDIEAGKAYTALLAVSVALSTASLLAHWIPGVGLAWRRFMAAVVVLNPIVAGQVVTYYVDAALYLLMALLIAAGLHWLLSGRRIWLVVAWAAGVLAINTKFAAVPFVALLVLGTAGYLVVSRQYAQALKSAVLLTAILVGGVVAFGFSPYVRNFVDHGHPLYPAYGPQRGVIVGQNAPAGIRELPTPLKLPASLFSVVSVDMKAPLELRAPFVLRSLSEVRAAAGTDTRLSGFGFWFSGILLLGIAALAWAVRWADVGQRRALLFLAGTVTLSAVLHPEAWWARYVPQLWLVPLFGLGALLAVATPERRSRGASVLCVLLAGALTVNAGVLAVAAPAKAVLGTLAVNEDLRTLRQLPGPIHVDFGSFKALRMRLEGHGVAFTEVTTAQLADCPDPRTLAGTHAEARACEAR